MPLLCNWELKARLESDLFTEIAGPREPVASGFRLDALLSTSRQRTLGINEKFRHPALKINIMNTTPITHEETRQLAYQLWERANCPKERAADFWIAAEKQLRAMHEAQHVLASQAANPGTARAKPTAPKRAPKILSLAP